MVGKEYLNLPAPFSNAGQGLVSGAKRKQLRSARSFDREVEDDALMLARLFSDRVR